MDNLAESRECFEKFDATIGSGIIYVQSTKYGI